MKHILFSFAVSCLFLGTGSFASAKACEQQELQFFGTVHNTQTLSTPVGAFCTYQIEIAAYPEARPSGVCPLSELEAAGLTLVDLTCKVKNGDALSGVLVHKFGNTWLE